MDSLVKILIVEDEMIIAAKISMQLTNLGYEVTGLLRRGKDAVMHVQENLPDIILMDINLTGEMDGIETANQIHQLADIPIIYITANADEATFNRAKSSKPFAFISKPFKDLDLQRAIELTISRMALDDSGNQVENILETNRSYILSDRIFVRHKDKMVKIMIAAILYIEAERNYSRIFTAGREYLLPVTLKTIEEKFSKIHFVRIHRSYIVNLLHVDEVADGHVMIAQKAVSMSAGMKEQLMERIQTL